ncbi:MAG: hypothetical protein HQL54_09655 [Magnetococcales bacterium]|nr:hypothetical protein [Magnetococcales bacterium]
MDWWIAIRRPNTSNRKVIITQPFREEIEAEKEFASLRANASSDAEVCQPVQAATEQEAISRMKDLMGW